MRVNAVYEKEKVKKKIKKSVIFWKRQQKTDQNMVLSRARANNSVQDARGITQS